MTTQKNPYYLKEIDKLSETATVSYYDVESGQNLTVEEWKQLYLTNSDEITVINKSGVNYHSKKLLNKDIKVYGPGDEHLIALGLAAGVVVVGGAAIIATGGTATPLVAAGAKGAFEGYQAYQARGNLEARRVALGLGATAGAIALINNSSNSSSSSRTTKVTPCFEKKTIYDWWCNGLDSYEREILLENGYSDKSGCFDLDELKSVSERLFADKAPGRPTENDGFVPKKGWNGKTVNAPNSKKRGYPDNKGNVWVPSGNRGHGGANWEVQFPNGDHKHVYPGGKVRTHK